MYKCWLELKYLQQIKYQNKYNNKTITFNKKYLDQKL